MFQALSFVCQFSSCFSRGFLFYFATLFPHVSATLPFPSVWLASHIMIVLTCSPLAGVYVVCVSPSYFVTASLVRLTERQRLRSHDAVFQVLYLCFVWTFPVDTLCLLNWRIFLFFLFDGNFLFMTLIIFFLFGMEGVGYATSSSHPISHAVRNICAYLISISDTR